MSKHSGILLVNKPPGITSAAAIRKIKKKFGVKKIGHGGTLDPFASGLLVVLVGEATKIARFLLEGVKAYEALAMVGMETDTGDHEGTPKVTERSPNVSHDDWEKARVGFLGEIEQVPPVFSAIKVKGRPAYSYARAAEPLVLASRQVQIYALQIMEYSTSTIRFHVECSGGTYIRKLAEDWARAAGTRAYLQELKRTRVGKFTIANSHHLADLLDPQCLELPSLVSIATALEGMPKIVCTPELVKKIYLGQQNSLQNFLAASMVENKNNFQDAEFVLLLHPQESQENWQNNPKALALVSRAPGTGFRLDRVFNL